MSLEMGYFWRRFLCAERMRRELPIELRILDSGYCLDRVA